MPAFPVRQPGRLPHHTFRGLLSVHSRCGPHGRQAAQGGPSSKCFNQGRCLPQPLRLLPAGATVAGRDSHPLGKGALHGALSSLGLDDGPLLLDGHNNVGFSGGPVARRGTREEQTVIGVVSGYRFDRHRVRDEHGNETSHTYDTNTGIIIAHDIRHALGIVGENPIGIVVD